MKQDVYSVPADTQTFDLLSYRMWREAEYCEEGPPPPPPTRTKAEAKAQVEALLRMLPEVEFAAVSGRLARKSENEIGREIGVVQSAVSEAYSQAIKKLQVLVKLPCFTEEEFIQDLSCILSEREIKLLWLWWETSSWTRVAESGILSKGQSFFVVRRAISKISLHIELSDKYSVAMQLLLDNPGVKDKYRANRWRAKRCR